ncbi:hypothetical protein EVAR_80346_1 [Eumeta japonica]|uniref:Uncharacterized protein n=1 Tax=Eumeta variegata TaxID=151549 RepID=A0A4C1X0B1_EUMVA|nr:hypothetical protein EVAR_80346_1 [Eumeta japonica]
MEEESKAPELLRTGGNTTTESVHSRLYSVSAVSYQRTRPIFVTQLRYPVPIQKTGNAPATPLDLNVRGRRFNVERSCGAPRYPVSNAVRSLRLHIYAEPLRAMRTHLTVFFCPSLHAPARAVIDRSGRYSKTRYTDDLYGQRVGKIIVTRQQQADCTFAVFGLAFAFATGLLHVFDVRLIATKRTRPYAHRHPRAGRTRLQRRVQGARRPKGIARRFANVNCLCQV